MGKRSVDYNEYLYKRLKDPAERQEYINAALEDGDPQILLAMLKDCVEAMGGITWLSRQTGLTRPTLYKMLSEDGNPKFDSLEKVLAAFDLRLGVVLVKRPKKKALAHA